MFEELEPGAEPPPGVAERRVLVVDDCSITRRIVSSLIQRLDIANTVIEAEDGLEALDKLEKSPVDLVISDWSMPRMTGLDLLKAVRADERLARIPVLLISAEAGKHHIVDAVRAGADGYIVKPFTSDVLGDKIKTILNSRYDA